MGFYTRQQALLLLLLLAVGGGGLAVQHWRAAHPALAARLEQLDGEIAQTAEPEVDPPGPPRPVEARTPRGHSRESSEARPARSRPLKVPPPASSENGVPLDLNRATLADFVRLPGVGPVIARRILEAREEAGRFGAVDDLVLVRGLGRARLERIRPFVGVPE